LSALHKEINPLVISSFKDGEKLDLTDTKQIGATGFIAHEGSIYYLSSYPIIHSDETGPCVGSFTFGRLIDDTEIDFLTSDLDFPFSTMSIDKTGLSQKDLGILLNQDSFIIINKSSIVSYKTINDIFGEPSIAIRFESPRVLYQQGSSFISNTLFLIASGCIAILLLILFLLNRTIVRPLANLAKDVRHINRTVTDLPMDAHSSSREMYTLTNSINIMLNRIRMHKETIEENNKQLVFQANYDTLTGLRNRFSASQQLDEHIKNDENLTPFSVFFLDIDRFKNINDTMGHNAGDNLIMSVGKRLQENFGNEMVLARVGGDEFFIVSKNFSELQNPLEFVNKIFAIFQQPFHIRHRDLLIDISIGSSTFPLDGYDAETLIKNAEMAMHRAKLIAKSHYVVYQKEFHLAMEHTVFV